MTSVIRIILEMTARVIGFCLDYPSTDPGYLIVVNRLQETYNRAQQLSAQQHTGLAGAKGARALRDELRRSIQQDLVRYLIAIGGVVSKERTDLAAKFRLPRLHASNAVFLVAVKALLAEAESQKELLVKEGMSVTLLEDFAREVAELDAAVEANRNSRRDHMAARADLDLVGKDLVELVRALDGINRWRFRRDPQVKAEWDTVKSMRFRPRPADAPPAGGEGTVPPGTVAPAA
jgi:hypothetical protein